MEGIVAKSYAKINLLLNITGRRPDGYHTLDGVMIPVSVYDTVRVIKARGISVTCDDPRIASGPENTAFRAASLFFARTGIQGGAEIFLQKRIPHEAGLGGGSSNAACVLRVLRDLYAPDLEDFALREMAGAIGADVPFFLAEGAQRARGIGDELTPIEYTLPYPFVIAKPQGGVNTAAAYAYFHRTKPAAADVPACIEALRRGDLTAFAVHTQNMLEPAGIALCPQVGDALQALYAAGALFARMTGSGSAVYGMFPDTDTAKKAAEDLRGGFEFASYAEYTPHACETVLRIHGAENGLETNRLE